MADQLDSGNKGRGRKRAAPKSALSDGDLIEPLAHAVPEEVPAAEPAAPQQAEVAEMEQDEPAAAAPAEQLASEAPQAPMDAAPEAPKDADASGLSFGDLLMGLSEDGGARYYQVVRTTKLRAAVMRVGVAPRSLLPRLNAFVLPEDAPEQLVRLGATDACHITSGRLFWRREWPTDAEHAAAAAGRAAGWNDGGGWLRAYVGAAYEDRDRVARLYAAEKGARSEAARERIAKRARRDAANVVGVPVVAAAVEV